MECPRCKGKGYIHNSRYFGADDWCHDIKPTTKCKKCNGSGFIVGNIQEIVDRLRCAVNGVTITKREAQQMLDVILK